MKKVLFATTALVATASVAAADVTFGGYGRFGVLYSDNGTTDTTDVTSRFRLQIDATAESDAGVTFGARARIQQDNDGAATTGARLGTDGVAGTADDANFRDDREETGINGVRFFARSGGLEVGVGNIFGALEFMPGQYTIDLGLTGHSYDYTAVGVGGYDAYNSDTNGSAGANGVEVLYSIGDFSAHVSASDTNDRVAAHAAYKFNGITLAAGYQDSNVATDTEFALSAVGSFAGAKVSLAYAETGAGVGRTSLMASYDVSGATNVHGYIADQDGAAETSYGIGVHHDLGGGTSLRGGVSSTFTDATLFDLGVRFNF